MSLSKFIAEVGPVFLNIQIAEAKRRGEDTSLLEEYGPHAVNALSDSLLEKETQQKDLGKARFIANIASDLLRDSGAGSEITENEVDNAVRLAKRLVAQAEKAAAE